MLRQIQLVHVVCRCAFVLIIIERRNILGRYDSLIADKPMPDSHQTDENGETIRRNVIQLNSTIIPGAPYLMLTWYHKPIGPTPEEHVHDFDEYVGFIGTDLKIRRRWAAPSGFTSAGNGLSWRNAPLSSFRRV
jgi:hypothetical protein